MSGIEVAGLAFGVLPILVEAVKSYKDVSKKIHTLRHHSKAVKSVSEQLKVHSGIFLNEIRLLLRCVETEEEVEAMLNDAADQRWISTHLNEKLRKVLQDSFEICHGIIEAIQDAMAMVKKEMSKFDKLLSQKSKVGGPCPADRCVSRRHHFHYLRTLGRIFQSCCQTPGRRDSNIDRSIALR